MYMCVRSIVISSVSMILLLDCVTVLTTFIIIIYFFFLFFFAFCYIISFISFHRGR
jgi:hypothetical protein